MFAYSDPTETGFLQQAGALQAYREMIEALHQQFHALKNSGFTLREAFDELAAGVAPGTATINWKAFPVTAQATPAGIDGDRFQFQDEYVEWRVERKSDGSLARVTFTTEFPEYFQALAQVGADRLKEEVARLHPGANPTDKELFGGGFNPATATRQARANQFRRNLPRNPWNNGEQDILCLTLGANNMFALFSLLGVCGVPRPDLNPGDVCANSEGACVPNRNSDPSVCIAAQNLARADRSFCPQDPCGIRILDLDRAGQWTVDGQAVDINDEAANRGIWKVMRNGRRGVFTFQGDVRLAGARIQTGAALSEQLNVGADVVHAPNAALPEWARRGNEPLRGPGA
jgi:hypothetical protein